MTALRFPFDNSYARDLADFALPCAPETAPAPALQFFNRSLAAELQLPLDTADDATLAALFSGNALPEGATPITQAYAGHQFGFFAPQLGDGRALLLGEVIDRQGTRRDIALKGSGRTPFSRRGDGKAALGPMLREVIIGEAMHALGIPTTRALAVVTTGEAVYRERPLPGAVLTRVADSHVRVGTFEFFAARGDLARVKRLADYCIARHYPEAASDPQPYLAFLHAVIARQADLLARWMAVGFIHGVMNTDNMSIAGETIDYGPCAFMETYRPDAVFSSIDEHGRYAYENQPGIAHWNLTRLAHCLGPLLEADETRAASLANAALDGFETRYLDAWLARMRDKLGLDAAPAAAADDSALIVDWLTLLDSHAIDFTLAWRAISAAPLDGGAAARRLFADPAPFDEWLTRWTARTAGHGHTAAHRAAAMRAVNPRIIPRNHRVEDALSAATENGDLSRFQALLAAVSRPGSEEATEAPYADPAPAAFTAAYRTFCGT